MPKLKIREMPPTIEVDNDGFFSQWCCDCGLRHIWHLHIERGKNPQKDFVTVSCFGDDSGTRLLKFYKKHQEKRRRKKRG